MKNKYLKILIVLLVAVGFCLTVSDFVLADGPTGFFKGYSEFSQGLVGADAASKTTKSVPEFVGQIINYVAAVLSIVFFVLTLYYGIYYMLSRGETDKVNVAKKGLKYSIIGLIIIIMSFSLAHLVVSIFEQASESTRDQGVPADEAAPDFMGA